LQTIQLLRAVAIHTQVTEEIPDQEYSQKGSLVKTEIEMLPHCQDQEVNVINMTIGEMIEDMNLLVLMTELADSLTLDVTIRIPDRMVLNPIEGQVKGMMTTGD